MKSPLPLLLSLLSWGGAACSTNEAGAPLRIEPATLYAQNCARCHGPEGKPDPNLKAAMPTLRDFTDPAFRQVPTHQVEAVIMGGKNQMPPFGGMLSPAKIQAVAGHVRRLGAGQK
jgi:mono/diheme cytochrome c family protein